MAKTVNNNSKAMAIAPIILFVRRAFSKDTSFFEGISVALNSSIKGR